MSRCSGGNPRPSPTQHRDSPWFRQPPRPRGHSGPEFILFLTLPDDVSPPRKISRLRHPREPETEPRTRWLQGLLRVGPLLGGIGPASGCDLPHVPHLREAEEEGDHHGGQQYGEFRVVRVTKCDVTRRLLRRIARTKRGQSLLVKEFEL